MKAKLLFVFFVFPLFLLSQEKHYGISVGVNFSKWGGDEDLFAQELSNEMNLQDGFSGFDFSPEMRTGINLAFFIEYPIKNSLTIQPELSYSQKGVKFKGTGSYGDYYDNYSTQVDMVYQTDYADLVVLAKYYFTNGNTKPYIFAGPGAGFLVKSTIKVDATVEGESNSDSSDIDMDQKFDANLNVGGGLNFSDQVRLELRYCRGLISIFDDNDYKLNNSVISINLIACF
ncbi:hypothetical protein MASR2M47_16040 [Draconibacterium sp.]|jgi:hypothetical protein